MTSHGPMLVSLKRGGGDEWEEGGGGHAVRFSRNRGWLRGGERNGWGGGVGVRIRGC